MRETNRGQARIPEPLWRLVTACYRGWMTVVGAFSWVIVRVATIAVYIVGFVPYGLVMRAIGFDPLDRQLDDRETYWTEVEGTNDDLERFRRQY